MTSPLPNPEESIGAGQCPNLIDDVQCYLWLAALNLDVRHVVEHTPMGEVASGNGCCSPWSRRWSDISRWRAAPRGILNESGTLPAVMVCDRRPGAAGVCGGSMTKANESKGGLEAQTLPEMTVLDQRGVPDPCYSPSSSYRRLILAATTLVIRIGGLASSSAGAC